MDIKVQKQDLTNAINLASRFTSNKLGNTAGLQGILFLNKNHSLHLYATNLNSFFHTKIQSDSEGDARFILDYHMVIEFVTYLQEGDVVLSIGENKITIIQKKTKGTFPFIPQNDFPLPPVISEGGSPIEMKEFQKIISLVLFSASRDLSRPVLSGVNFVEKNGEIDVVATDGFRLSLFHMKNGLKMRSMLIPAEFLLELLRHTKEQKNIQMSFSEEEKVVFFKAGNDEYYSRLIEGEYPPYEKVVPVEKKTTVIVDREELIRNIKLISIFAREFSSIVVCHFKKGELILSPKTEGGVENTTTQDVEFDGEEMAVAFNFRFLLEFLSIVNDSTVTIELIRPDAPVVLKTKSDKDFLHIIMPVRIQE